MWKKVVISPCTTWWACTLFVTVWLTIPGCDSGNNGAGQTNSNTNSPGSSDGDSGAGAGGNRPDDALPFVVTVEGQGRVDQISAGNLLTLTAVPETGWEFDGWFGTTESEANPITLEVSANTLIGARFVLTSDTVVPPAGSDGDRDDDGIGDVVDLCPETPTGAAVGDDGCSLADQDSDHDGVNDADDKCPDSISIFPVDSQGCTAQGPSEPAPLPVPDDEFLEACQDTAGACNESHESTGCDEAECCMVVCSFDAVCCTDGWDEHCAGLAAIICDLPGNPTCGDGVIGLGEQCDPPTPGTCDQSCRYIVKTSAGGSTWFAQWDLIFLENGLYPTTYRLDAAGQLVQTIVSIDTTFLDFLGGSPVIEIQHEVPLGNSTPVLRLSLDDPLVGQLQASLDLRIDQFQVTRAGDAVTWSFDMTFDSSYDDGVYQFESTVRYEGQQQGIMEPNGSRIDWQTISGTITETYRDDSGTDDVNQETSDLSELEDQLGAGIPNWELLDGSLR